LFRFKNYWVQSAHFQEVIASAWHCHTDNSEPATVLFAKLKETRFALNN
jgi:hypothetical protein